MSVPRIELADRSTPVVPDGWRELAACRGHGDLFFPTEVSVDVARIRAMCAACPVLAECREDALTAPEAPHGWQAGMSPDEQRDARRGVPKRRRHGPNTPRCGTAGGYAAHKRRGEEACQACRYAHAAYVRSRRTA